MAVLDFPASPTMGQVATLTNGFSYQWDGTVWTLAASTGQAAGGDLQGTYPNPTIKPSALPWTPSGATLTPTDATKAVSITSAGLGLNAVQFGPVAVKGRLVSPDQVAAGAVLSCNSSLNATATAWVQDDPSRAGWHLNLGASDQLYVFRTAPSNGAGTQPLTLDNAGKLTLAATGGTGTIQFGTAESTTRLLVPGMLSANYFWSGTWQRDNPAYAGWYLSMNPNPAADNCSLVRDAGSPISMLIVSNLGNMTIYGPTATKASGTTWANPSDIRLKKDVAPYIAGLNAILALEPISFFYNGKGGTTDDGRRCYGYDAGAVQAAFPEAVGTRRGKLEEADAEEADILTLDTSNFTLALINAVKELAARVTALESVK
jgi:Chaperone of endosialidase